MLIIHVVMDIKTPRSLRKIADETHIEFLDQDFKMGIELYFSHQLEHLSDRFLATLAEENRKRVDIFETPTVIVPNSNLAKWLKLSIAKTDSIFMNMDFQYLEAGLWEMFSSLDANDADIKRLNNDHLKILSLHAFHNMNGDASNMSLLSGYITDENGEKGPDYAARLWQLSKKMAYLFREYEFHRTEMINRWLDKNDSPVSAKHAVVMTDMEQCQRQVYLKLKQLRADYSQRTGELLLSLMEYADTVFSRLSSDTTIVAEKKDVHLFGFSQISPFHLKLLDQLKAYYDMHLYVLNPFREFWEGINTSHEKEWIRRKNITPLSIQHGETESTEPILQEGNSLLTAWGRPGRENIRSLCELTDYEFNVRPESFQKSPGILKRIQNTILGLASPSSDTDVQEQDRSLQVVACPSIYREVETVYNSILYNLDQHDDLQLTDIAILVPDIPTYKPVFDSVFDRNPQSLAYNIVNARAKIESIYGQAVISILGLAVGRFSRKAVFDLICNPCFMDRWNINSDELGTWIKWADRLNIFHTFDRQQKDTMGYPSNSAYTWEWGLKRLRLSRILAKTNTSGVEDYKHFRELIPFEDMESGDFDLVEKFCMVIEVLHHTLDKLKTIPATVSGWKQIFFDVCDRLISIPKNLPGEAIVRHTLVQAFDTLELYDQLQDRLTSSPLDIELIREFVVSNLGSLSGGYGDYLTGGITISELQPMRPIPFNIVYIMGMEEGNFPGRSDTSSLDLRLLKRKIGDVNLPERNCYLFLETLLSTRKKLYITYVSRDLQKDRSQLPSSVVNRLIHHVEQDIFPGNPHFQTAEIPIKGSSVCYLEPGATNAWSDVMVNYSMADRIDYYRAHQLWEQFCETSSTDDQKRTANFNPNFVFNRIEHDDTNQTVEKITLKQLKRFLEDPVKQNIQRHLKLYEEKESTEEMVLREDEPFFSEFPVNYYLKMDPIRYWLDTLFSSGVKDTGIPTSEDIYDRIYENHRMKGQTPEGAFAELDKNEFRNDFSRIIETLIPITDQMGSAKELYRAVYIGEYVDEYLHSDTSLSVKRFDGLSLTVRTTNHANTTVSYDAELHGQLPWIWKDASDTWHALILTGAGKGPANPDQYIFDPVLFYMLLLMDDESSEWVGTSDVTFHVIYHQNIREWAYNFDKETSKKYMTNLVSDYLNQETPVWLPFSVLRRLSIKPYNISDDHEDDIEREQFKIELEDAYSETDDDLIRLIKPIIPSDAFDVARRRLGVFFENKD